MVRLYNATGGTMSVVLASGATTLIRPRQSTLIEDSEDGSPDLLAKVRKGLVKRIVQREDDRTEYLIVEVPKEEPKVSEPVAFSANVESTVELDKTSSETSPVSDNEDGSDAVDPVVVIESVEHTEAEPEDHDSRRGRSGRRRR